MNLFIQQFNEAILAGLKFLEGFEEIPLNERLTFALQYARDFCTWRNPSMPVDDRNIMDIVTERASKDIAKYEDSKILEEILQGLEKQQPKKSMLKDFEAYHTTNTKIIEDYDYRKDGFRKDDYGGLLEKPLGF